jgi:hypothetical protein
MLYVSVDFFFIVVLGGVHWSICKSSYYVSNISYLNSPPQLLSVALSPPIPGAVIKHLCTWIFLFSTYFDIMVVTKETLPE